MVFDAKFVKGKRVPYYEYLCRECKQLRLACVDVDKCSNCGSSKIIKGELGTFKKE